MLNYVANRLSIIAKNAERLNEVLESFKTNEQEFDFNTLIPQPKDIDDNWYEWRVAYWGTKWNAYEIRISVESPTEALIEFDTAWNTPLAIFHKIVEKFPDIEIEVLWANENTGRNCGSGHGVNGEFSYYMPEELSDEAYEISFRCHEWTRDFYRKIDGEWVFNPDSYVDEEYTEIN